MTAGAATTGLRAWVASRRPRWLTPIRLKRLSTALLILGVLAAGLHGAPAGGGAAANAARHLSSRAGR